MNDFAAFDDSLQGSMATVGNNGARMAEMNKGVCPIFFEEELPDDAATQAAGTLRMRKFERVRIVIAGDMNSAAVHPVTQQQIDRFPVEYERWKATRNNDHISGTPLSAWAMVSKGQVMELAALHIRSVEDLASVSDANIGKILDGRQWRERAKAWLETNKDAAVAMKYAAENERLRADLDDLRGAFAELKAQVEAKTPARKAA